MGYYCLMCKKPTYKKFKKFQPSFHAFPKCPIQKKIWMKKCKLTTLLHLKYPKICSFHFEPGCFKINTKTRVLKPDAVPTIFVRRFMKKKLFKDGICKDTPKLCNWRKNCILCVKSDSTSTYYIPKDKLPLHSFPKCRVRRQEWINRCQLTDKVISSKDKICALHFEDGCYKPDGLRLSLNPDAVPTVFEMDQWKKTIGYRFIKIIKKQ